MLTRLRQFLTTSKRATTIAEGAALLTCVGSVVAFLTPSIFNALPATGGDTGSHFWPVQVLHDYGLPNLTLRPWNPGNNGGEGLLVHYFPLPFVLMAILGYVIPIGTAFNVGTILPVVGLPIAVWGGLRLAGARFPVAILAAAFSLMFLLNEGYTMWGGNALSTLAGQFAHMYALDFLLLGFGLLAYETRKGRLPWCATLAFVAVALSHAYVYLAVPAMLLLFVLCFPVGTWRARLAEATVSGGASLLVSAWFIGPMVLNAVWTTPHTFQWEFRDWIGEVVPRIFDPGIALFVASILWLTLRRPRQEEWAALRLLTFWIGAALVYVGLFVAFRRLKLVDVRAIPQIQLFVMIAAGIAFGSILQRLPRHLVPLVTLIAALALTGWAHQQVTQFANWAEWNYSGWQAKDKYNDLQKLAQALRGDLSAPRVAYEHDVEKNKVGTERVFEMLPYFAGRATTESLYLQSTVLAPMAFHLQAQLSRRPSCPFQQWPCPTMDVASTSHRLDLLGVGQVILSSDVALAQASKVSFLKPTGVFGAWHLFDKVPSPKMVDFLTKPPRVVPFDGWRDQFWAWYGAWTGTESILATVEPGRELPDESSWVPTSSCEASVRADFSGLFLTTSCPGVAHLLKYAYNSAFRSSGGEDLFLLSPGMIGIVPRERETHLRFGAAPSWTAFNLLSWVSGLVLAFSTWWETRRRRAGRPGLLAASHGRAMVEASVPSWYLNGHKILFGTLLGIAAMAYVLLSIGSSAWAPWHWRSLNFDAFHVISVTQQWGSATKNRGLGGEPVRVGGKHYKEVLTTHASSDIEVELRGSPTRLRGACGYPDYVSGGEIFCEIVAGGDKSLFLSGPLNERTRTQAFEVDVGDLDRLSLRIRSTSPSINAAHAVWLDLQGID